MCFHYWILLSFDGLVDYRHSSLCWAGEWDFSVVLGKKLVVGKKDGRLAILLSSAVGKTINLLLMGVSDCNMRSYQGCQE